MAGADAKTVPMAIAILLGAGGYVGYNLIYLPKSHQVDAIRQKILEEQSNHQAQLDLAGLLREIEQHKKRLPQEPDPSWLAREVLAIGREADVDLKTIVQEEPQQQPDFVRLAVRLEFSATYHQLGTLLDRFERSRYFLRVERLDMEMPVDGHAIPSIELVLSTVYLPPVIEAPAG